MTQPQSEFESLARQDTDQSLLGEFLGFLRHNKKWWLMPIVIVLMVLSMLIMLSSTAAAPFIYPF